MQFGGFGSARLHGDARRLACSFFPAFCGWTLSSRSCSPARPSLRPFYSLFTNYELGLFKVLPMKAHLGLDAAQSAALAAAPIAFAQNKRTALPLLLGLSIIEAAVTLNTQSRPQRRFLWFKY